MADSTQTVKETAPASGAADPSPDANSNAGSDSSKTSTQVVDKGSDAGNSGGSDDPNGAAGDGDRRRPGQAERRISELTSKIKTLEAELDSKNQLDQRLQNSPVDASKIDFPDYSKVSEITPEQLKADIIKTAEQIVDQKMTVAGTALQEGMTQRQAMTRSNEAIEATISKYSVLNPQSDDYDADLDHEITTAYADILQKDPTYSFASFIKPFVRILEAPDTTSSRGASKIESRGRSANRSNAPVRKNNEFPANGTAEEMEKWFAENRG